MLKGTTKSGFRYEVTTERLNNFELVETLSEVDENPLLLPKVLNLLLGERQSKNLKNYLRDEEGLVSTDKIRETIEDIFAAQNKIKN